MVFSKALLFGVFAASVSAQSSSTCSAFSAPAGACPTPYNSCCAFICGEAQVPFAVCQPTDGSGNFAQCSACPGGPTTATSETATTTATQTADATTEFVTSVTSVPESSTTDTCTNRSAPNGACPTAFDSCCAFICAEAQVPFAVCQPTDGSGTFAQCTACPGGTASATSTIPTTTIPPSSSMNSVPTYNVTTLPPPIYSSGASANQLALSGVAALSLLFAGLAL
ncbi:hypothetical protein H072_10964 [Dactylellina haptotyla CBS 200.50]|uniref:Uncharacterized protein n=1 Tax=Dactylellina haptotyla (strain CBS 200.50) TaxID=1284197 RepID=S8B965_DACHA|nr:hypothetical protein H072_10964 [Dactylellina haptotyla CBS 200.50]